jgi:D-tyrosyl-tRNA(Tyr) deacylase
MRAVVQRVREASVSIGGNLHSRIGTGLLVLLGVHEADDEADAAWLAAKIAKLRIFADAAGLMNLSVQDVGGDILVVSQFTLHAAYAKGNRPSFIAAAKPEHAIPLYERFINELEALLQKRVPAGVFGADMQVALTNDGPVTIIMDSRNRE